MINTIFGKLQTAATSNRVANTFGLHLYHYCKESISYRTFIITKILFSKENVSLIKFENDIANSVRLKSDTEVLHQLKKKASIWKKPVSDYSLTSVSLREKFIEYIQLLGQKDVNFSQFFPTIQNSKYDFKDHENIFKLKDKIFELALLLKCSPDEAYRFILKHEFLAQSKLSTLEKKVNLLLENDIFLSDLKRDLWVLSYTISKLEARISKIRNLDLPMKCWMLRCQESTLKRSWEKREQDKAALIPFTNSREYLCNRLKMNECQLHLFSNKHPAVLKINMVKLKQVLDYLFNEGFTQSQIYATPRILCHSISTIKVRLSILRKFDCEPRTLSLLCMSAKAFDIYIQKLSKPIHILE